MFFLLQLKVADDVVNGTGKVVCMKGQCHNRLIEFHTLLVQYHVFFSQFGSSAYGRGGGGEGSCSPPQILGNSVFWGSKRKFGQSQILKTSPCLFSYFEDLNINLNSA